MQLNFAEIIIDLSKETSTNMSQLYTSDATRQYNKLGSITFRQLFCMNKIRLLNPTNKCFKTVIIWVSNLKFANEEII